MTKVIKFSHSDIPQENLHRLSPTHRRPFEDGTFFVARPHSLHEDDQRKVYRWLGENTKGWAEIGTMDEERIYAFEDSSDAGLFMIRFS